MTEKEVGELYIRLAFQYESAISRLLDKKIIDQDLVDRHRKSFYDSLDEEKLRAAQKIGDYTEIIRRYVRGIICEDMVSLTGLAKQYSVDSPGYTIQSWMRSRNTLEFLRQWENDMNAEFDDRACEELIKGMEFDHVFIPNLTEDKLPDPDVVSRAVSKEDAYADEIKLLYVAVTRSRYGLYMTFNGTLSSLFPVDSDRYDFYGEENL